MLKINDKEVFEYLVRTHKEAWQGEVKEINPFGIRNEKEIKEDVVNDVIGLFTNKGETWITKGTTDPGVFYTKYPMNKRGCAHLMSGYQKDIWHVGLQGGNFALVNDSKTEEQRVWRDKDKNFKLTPDKDDIFDTGHFACNLHGMFNSKLKEIGKNSAGCQVVLGFKELYQYMNIVKSSDMYLKYKGVTLFSNYLYELNKMPRGIADKLYYRLYD